MRGLAFALPSAALLALACSSPAALVGAGGQCEQATDCQEGLVCIPQSNGTRICSNDLQAIQNTEIDSGTDATMAIPDSTTPLPDGTSQDVAPPPTDVGPPPQDTSPPPDDTGPPPQDSGPPPQDSGPPPQDSAPPPEDSGGADAAGD